MSLASIDRADRGAITIDERDNATQFLREAVADRVNQALDHTDLSPTALRSETADLLALQQLALLYAEVALNKTDWIHLHCYVAQLAVTEGAQSLWQWQAMDLMAFTLHDYLADRPDAGDALLHEIVAFTRQGAAGAIHDAYRRAGRHHYNAIRSERADDGTLDNLCAMVVARRHASGATPGAR
ncbi:hypothetical protein [Salinisphaera orenii]|uniref:hypothetical protein n=1 Tax=Salinisphaera orenii TaxID=856731 RepID=UPI000DBE9F4D